jgi:hypothetical protein
VTTSSITSPTSRATWSKSSSLNKLTIAPLLTGLLLAATATAAAALLCSGCALFRENAGPPTSYAPREQFFTANFEVVWRAAQRALQAYPMRINNMDTGIIETETIRGYKAWMPPYEAAGASGGFAYYLSIHLIKGSAEAHETVKVSILKSAQLNSDFFAEPKNLASDGLEERTILYRIGRELAIEKAAGI